VLVTFDVLGERYSILFKNPQGIEQVLATLRIESQAKTPNGRLVRDGYLTTSPGAGTSTHGRRHGEMTIEIYDGLPSHVEEGLDYWLETVKRFAPWKADIVSVQDYR